PQRLASEFIGVSRDFLALPGMLKLLTYQVLLPRLCSHCKLSIRALSASPYLPKGVGRTRWREWLNIVQQCYGCNEDAFYFRNPAGCDACNHDQAPELSGYAGRTVAAECLEPVRQPGFLGAIRQPELLDQLHDLPVNFPGAGDASLCSSAL